MKTTLLSTPQAANSTTPGVGPLPVADGRATSRSGAASDLQRTLFELVESKSDCGYRILEIATGDITWSRGLYDLLAIDPLLASPDQDAFERLVHPQDLAGYRKSLPLRVVNGGLGPDTEFRVIRRNGTTRWLACRSECLFSPEGEATHAVSVFFDITPRMEARRRVEELEHLQLRLARTVSAAAWALRPDGTKPDSPAWQELTGQSEAEAAGQGWLDAVHPDDRARVRTAWSRALASGEALTLGCRLHLREGRERRCALRLVPVVGETGERQGWIAACLDIDALDPAAEPGPPLPERPGQEAALSSAHLRAARGALNWSVRELADAAGVTPAIIRKYEEGLPTRVQDRQIAAIRSALVQAGVSFLVQADGSIAVGIAAPTNFAKSETWN